MCVVDIDTGPALRLPLSVGPATHYQPLTGQATPSLHPFSISPHPQSQISCPSAGIQICPGGKNLDFSGRNFGFAATSWGRLIRQQSVRRKPRGAEEREREGEISSTRDEQR